jgi:hypothetical protein
VRLWRRAGNFSRLFGHLMTIMTRIFVIAVLLSIALTGSGCGAAQQAANVRPSADSAVGSSSVIVPDVAGLPERLAARKLAVAGLTADVRYEADAPRTGVVLRSHPRAGSATRLTIVRLDIALAPRQPTPTIGHEQDLHALGTLIDTHPGAFVGLYLDETALPHVVFGPGVDAAAWTERLGAAAGSLPYETDACNRGRQALHAIQDDIASNQDWTKSNHLAFGVGVDPGTCTARIESDLLTPREMRSLARRFGTAVSFDTTPGSHPVLLPLAGHEGG